MSTVVTSSSSLLQLICYMKGEPFKQVFKVKIGNEESISDLKEAIKAKRAQTFSNVDAASIVLWNVSIPYSLNLTDDVDMLRFDDGYLRSLIRSNHCRHYATVGHFLEASYRRICAHHNQATASSIDH